MITIDLSASSRVKRWLKDNKINFRTLQQTAHIFFNQIQRRSKYNKLYDIKIMVCHNNSSGYYFGFNEVHITENLDQNGWSKEKKLETFVCHFLHELRHWMQDNLLRVDEHKLNYSDQDCEDETNKYYYNEWEVDARRFERRYKKEFIDLYKTLLTLSKKKI